MNPTAVHWINVLSHVCGAYWLWYAKWSTWPTWIMLCSLMASCTMHISETKHGLDGMGYFASISQVALNIDRLFAVLLAITCLCSSVFWNDWILYTSIFGLLSICTILGEMTADLTQYVLLHTIWHIGVFFMAGRILVHTDRHQWITSRPM